MFPPLLQVPTLASIAEVDAFIKVAAQTLIQGEEQGKLFEKRIWNESYRYRCLRLLKHVYGSNPTVDRRFREGFERNARSLEETSATSDLFHLRAFETGFGALNDANAGCFGGGRVKRFLDLGCSPGGFSSWLLKNNPDTKGTGVTLPEEHAKLPVQVEPALRSHGRYQVIYEDIIDIGVKALEQNMCPSIPLDDSFTGLYDLVIAGAFPTMQGRAPWWHRVQLLLSQLLIVLTHVAQGGSVLVLVKTKPQLLTMDILGVLQQVFRFVLAHKAGGLHSYCQSSMLASPTDPALNLANRMPLLSADSAEQVFDNQYRSLLQLLQPVWELQYKAIRKDLARILAPEKEATTSRAMSGVASTVNVGVGRPHGRNHKSATQSHKHIGSKTSSKSGSLLQLTRSPSNAEKTASWRARPCTDGAVVPGDLFGRKRGSGRLSVAELSTTWRARPRME
ncbi:hypothetical protein POSPLADRAFT_1143672 [Postia placenta MAD-698-R-SB12]|uniref:Ribosomal RNA methyltransferase FtsJ domain-containing protein n=1 Tax=Postia placenta MAD-698-R-SB12 TaxID=670580 RepID=A0A1X6N0J4_9APHY|nr:hypothetical protein POSPLADRAFT_1143672 [Postia placenta MAD-698-R-SB12]OSX62149.1 hypothetical protein POSPLADRAFT_1143672 [Postia placenta MAD-698-R-SB12]